MSACNGCKLKCEFTESRKFANRLCRCAIVRRDARRLCAANGTVTPPFTDGRKSVPSRAHTNMHATTERAEIPRSGNSLPRRAIALGYSPRPCAGSRKHRRPRLYMHIRIHIQVYTPTNIYIYLLTHIYICWRVPTHTRAAQVLRAEGPRRDREEPPVSKREATLVASPPKWERRVTVATGCAP